MAATIRCRDSIKKDIKDYILKEMGNLMSSIREDSDAVVVDEFEGELEIAFPIGEIYGYASDYVQNIPYIFKDLKKKYGDIAIRGIAYEYETIQEATFGPFFYCTENDTELTVTFEWQKCANCGEIIETDVVYNSSQRDFEEGNLLCLCCPTCMLEYALSKECGEVQPNGSFDEDEIDAIYDSDDEDKALKKLLWKRITLNLDEYAEDFRRKSDRVSALTNKKGITAARKKVIMSILEDKKEPQRAPQTSKSVEKIDFASSTFVITGFGYEQGERIQKELEQRNATVKERVSSKVQYLITPDGKFSKNGNYKKAEELINKGANITIITLKQYKKMLRKYDEMIYGSDGADVLEHYTVTINNGNVCLDSYIGNEKNIVIPENLGQYPVVQLGTRCFQWSKIESVNIPSTIKELPEEAFAYCNELTTVNLPEGLQIIGAGSFESCEKLQEIDLLDGLLTIGKRAFHDCKKLHRITFPGTLAVLEDDAFGGCAELYEVYIPASVQSIRSPFSGCNKLSKIAVDVENSVYDSRNSCNAIIETLSNTVIMGCPNTALPESVTCIGDSAFAGFDTLIDFVIPEGITNIGAGAFSSCFNLRSIKLSDSVETVGNYAFYFCRSLTKIELPKKLKVIHISAFGNCEKLTELVIGDKLTEISDIDNAWMYNCRISKVYGSKNSIAKDIAAKQRGEYIEI